MMGTHGDVPKCRDGSVDPTMAESLPISHLFCKSCYYFTNSVS